MKLKALLEKKVETLTKAKNEWETAVMWGKLKDACPDVKID